MRHLFILLACVCAFAESASAEVRRIALSSDGNTYAALSATEDGKCYVLVYDANDAATKPLVFSLGECQSGRFFLVGNDYALIEITDLEFVKRTVDGLQDFEAARWVSVNIETGETESILQHLGGADFAYIIEDSGEILATTPDDAGKAVFSRIDVLYRGPARQTRFESGRDELSYSLLDVNLKNGRTKALKRGSDSTGQWVVDENGMPIARIDFVESTNKVRFFVTVDGNLKRASSVSVGDGDIEKFVVVGRASEPNVAIVRVVDGEGALSYRQYNMLTGEFLSEPVVPAGRDVQETYDPRRAIAHGLIVDDGADVHHFDKSDQSLQRLMEKSIPGATAYVESVSSDGARALIRMYYADKPTEWYLFDRNSKRLEMIAQN